MRYPNLELIEYIFKTEVEQDFPRLPRIRECVKIRANVWSQLWPNTATGFSEPNSLSGQAFTEEYTTLMEMTYSYLDQNKSWQEGEPIFGVFFGNIRAYILSNPKQEFFDDWKMRRMCKICEAEERYIIRGERCKN